MLCLEELSLNSCKVKKCHRKLLQFVIVFHPRRIVNKIVNCKVKQTNVKETF